MEDFYELHGDRLFGDDAAIVAGLARFEGRTVVVVGTQKGRDATENVRRNFGMPHPEGYRKALRVMKLGERFGFPILTFIDTPGAYPGIGAGGAQHWRGARPRTSTRCSSCRSPSS
jgi:acetyl-CoA carboxylase carboxyl transferase subunit alpha